MTRLQQARHLAVTSEYWRAYLDGLDDKHRVRDTEPPPRRETWDSDWGPVPAQETPQPARSD